MTIKSTKWQPITEKFGSNLSSNSTLLPKKQADRVTSFVNYTSIQDIQSLKSSNTGNSLVERYEDTLFRASLKGLNIICLGYGKVFLTPELYAGEVSDWFVAPLGEDPAFKLNNYKLCVPKKVKKELKAYVEAGIDFDIIFIAHEIPKGSIEKPGDLKNIKVLLPPASKKQTERLSFGEKIAKNCSNLTERFFSLTIEVLKSLCRKEFFGEEVREIKFDRPMESKRFSIFDYEYDYDYDPILFGVQIDDNGINTINTYGLWYYLTHWYWE